MTPELTVHDAIALLRKHGHTTGYSIWSERNNLPLTRVDTGWQVTDTGYGWLIYRSEHGERVTEYRCYTSESQVSAALLAGVLGGEPPAPADSDAAFALLLSRWRHTPWRRQPVTRTALAGELARLGVPASAYSLFGGQFEGRLCLEERVSGWRLFRVRSGQAEELLGSASESQTCAEFWRRLVDEDLPVLLGGDTPDAPVIEEPVAPEDDLTLPEALAIQQRDGWVKSIGIISPSHGINRPMPVGDNLTHLIERADGHWELVHTERGQDRVQARFAREGDAVSTLIDPYYTAPGIASADRHADRFAGSRYGRLLHHWRQLPWRVRPVNVPDLALALRDFGFPYDSYRLGGGRAADGLHLGQRLDSWRVYRVRDGQRLGETRHHTVAEACAEFWRRAVDQLLPDLIATD